MENIIDSWHNLIAMIVLLTITTFVMVRILLDLLAASIIPLLAWLLANSVARPYRGVKR